MPCFQLKLYNVLNRKNYAENIVITSIGQMNIPIAYRLVK